MRQGPIVHMNECSWYLMSAYPRLLLSPAWWQGAPHEPARARPKARSAHCARRRSVERWRELSASVTALDPADSACSDAGAACRGLCDAGPGPGTEDDLYQRVRRRSQPCCAAIGIGCCANYSLTAFENCCNAAVPVL